MKAMIDKNVAEGLIQLINGDKLDDMNGHQLNQVRYYAIGSLLNIAISPRHTP